MPSQRTTEEYQQIVKQLTKDYDSEAFHKKLDAFYSHQPISKDKDPIENFIGLLESNFTVGEGHNETMVKNFLIQNFRILKEAGYDTFFVEGLNYAEQNEYDASNLAVYSQEDPLINMLAKNDKNWNFVNHYASQQDILKALQKAQLDEIGFKETRKYYEHTRKNNYTALIKAAKEAGIRVVGLDDECIYMRNHQLYKRVKEFNYFAEKIIELEQSGKWFALVGTAHVGKYHDIPGLDVLTGARSVVFEESAFNQAVFNKKLDYGEGSEFTADVKINSKLYSPPILLKEQVMTTEQTKRSVNSYRSYQAGFFGLRKLWKDKSSEETIEQLQNAQTDKDRFKIATQCLSKANDSELLRVIREELWPSGPSC